MRGPLNLLRQRTVVPHHHRLTKALVFVFCCVGLISQPCCLSQTTVKNWWSIDYGIIKVFFTTSKGSISVNIPDDAALGDTISGTILLEPTGATAREQQRSEEALNAYSVEIFSVNTPVKEGEYRIKIPMECKLFDVVLKDKTGKAVAKQPVTVSQVAAPPPSETFVIPTLISDDRTMRCWGKFDGNMGSAHVKFDRKEAPKVAASPRQLVVYPPEKKTGPVRVEISKGEQTSSATVYSIGLEMSQPAASMYRGSANSVVLTVNGAALVPEPVEVELENMSPTVAELAGGNKQIVTIPARSPDGFQVTRSLKGIKAGSYDVRATIAKPKHIRLQ
jgi:hypothetical protein